MADKTILLVEDDPNDQELALWALKKNNIGNVVIADDGMQALDYLFSRGMHAGRDSASNPDLILLDVNLPRISGLDTLKIIREDARTKLLPIVMLTSSKEDKDLITSYSLGANGYVRKPIDFLRFNEVVGQLGLYWLTLNVPPP